jgi:hypothetical protein
MRRLNLVMLGAVLLCTAAAGWAAEPPAVSVPTEESLTVPAAPEPVSLDLLLNSPQQTPAAIIPCPEEPIVSCNECFYFGQYLTYRCTIYCVNGQLHRSCGPCGSGCDP